MFSDLFGDLWQIMNSNSKMTEKKKGIKKLKKPNKHSDQMSTENSVKKNPKRKFQGPDPKSDAKKPKLINLKKKERKSIRKRKDHTETFERGQQLKAMWEEFRSKKCDQERKQELLNKAYNLIKGHAKELSYAHDTVRVIQSFFALSSDDQRAVIFDELKGDSLVLAKSKYGKKFLVKVFQNGSKSQKNYIVQALYGKVVELIRHTEAAEVVEVAFNECANATQRAELVQEFYGPTYRFFKESDCHNLQQLFEKNKEKKVDVLKHMKEAILKIVHKSVVRHSIFHFVVWEYLKHADHEDSKEVIEVIRDALVEMLHTKEGARIAMHCLWHGTKKDRKVIIKSFKTHLAKIATEEHGHMVLLALFDCVDDTRLVEKHIIIELMNNLEALIESPHGRKVLIYLLTPRDAHHFHPDIIKILSMGDSNVTSVKEPALRKSELKKAAIVPLMQYVGENASEFLKENSCCLFLMTLLNHAEGFRHDAYKAIARLAMEPYTSEGKNTHIIESPGTTYLLKKLLLDDKNPNKEAYFSNALVEEVPSEVMKTWIMCNRGCFLLVSLLETEISVVVEKVKEVLFGLHKQIGKKSFKGAEILLKKLKQ